VIDGTSFLPGTGGPAGVREGAPRAHPERQAAAGAQPAIEAMTSRAELADSAELSAATPAEYAPAQHVDPAVISGIAAWLGTR
jgi:hypothetical protein